MLTKHKQYKGKLKNVTVDVNFLFKNWYRREEYTPVNVTAFCNISLIRRFSFTYFI